MYYYYLQQRPEAVASINEVTKKQELLADTNQLLYYHYIKGSAALCEGETPDERRLREFDELYTAWQLASRKGSHALTRFGVPVDSLLPMRLGQLALQKFSQYKDLYQIAGAYVSIGKYLNAHSHYTEALDTLKLALECVNDHHRLFYDCHDSLAESICPSRYDLCGEGMDGAETENRARVDFTYS